MKKVFFKKWLVLIITVIFFIAIYLIGFFLIGGKKRIVNLNEFQKEDIINRYGINISCNDVILFEQISYNRKYANVLKINKTESIEKELSSNSNIEKIQKLDKLGFPYPNNKFIPYHTKKCCCFYDDNYYYLSTFSNGSEYNKKINDFFWEIYNTSQ